MWILITESQTPEIVFSMRMADMKVVGSPKIKLDFPKSSEEHPEKSRQGEDYISSNKKEEVKTLSPFRNNGKSSVTATEKMPESQDEKTITMAGEVDGKGKRKMVPEFEDVKDKGKAILEFEESEDEELYCDISDDSDSELSDGIDSETGEELPVHYDLDNFLPCGRK